jgi:hypothetical protein
MQNQLTALLQLLLQPHQLLLLLLQPHQLLLLHQPRSNSEAA